MDSKQLKNLKRGDYIWVRPSGTNYIGWISSVICVEPEIVVYSEMYGYDNPETLLRTDHEIHFIKDLKEVKPEELKESCYIVIEYLYKEKDRYRADVFNRKIKDNVLYLNGYEFKYDPSKHILYKVPR